MWVYICTCHVSVDERPRTWEAATTAKEGDSSKVVVRDAGRNGEQRRVGGAHGVPAIGFR